MKFNYNNIVVSDIETIIVNNKHIPILIGFYDGAVKKIIEISDQKNLIASYIADLTATYRGRTLIYFHNFAKFDGFILLKALIELNYKPKLIIRGSQIYFIKLKINKQEWHFKDSYLAIPFSLKKAALLFNKTYFKTEIPLNLFEKWQENTEKIKKYLENDLFTLYELITTYNKFMRKLFTKEIYYSLTIPSFTQKIFLEQFYKSVFTNLSSNQDEFIRESYLGGVVDVYKPYGKDLVLLDFNSMYPAIMRRIRFGTGRAKFVYEMKDLYDFCKNNLGFVKVKVTCKKGLKFPLITLKEGDKNIQPSGIFIQTVYTKEILYCLENYRDYYTFEFIRAVHFEETALIFEEYINKLFELRLIYKNNTNEAGEKLIKLMMNSLYGRFGINVFDNQAKVVNNEEEAVLLSNPDLNTKPVQVITDNLSIISYENIRARKDLLLKDFKSRVDWAATITAEARILMQSLKDMVEIYYMDTDALVIAKKDLFKLQHMIDPEKPGFLKIVQEIDEGYFVAPKVYLLKKDNNCIIKIKGINTNDLKISENNLEKLFQAKLNQSDSKISLIVNRLANFVRSIKDYTVSTELKASRLTLDYDKRTKIYVNGVWTDTEPLEVNE